MEIYPLTNVKIPKATNYLVSLFPWKRNAGNPANDYSSDQLLTLALPRARESGKFDVHHSEHI